MIFEYKFADNTVYKLIDVGFSAADLWQLEKLHGKLVDQKRNYKKSWVVN
jgi:hypothetical protein